MGADVCCLIVVLLILVTRKIMGVETAEMTLRQQYTEHIFNGYDARISPKFGDNKSAEVMVQLYVANLDTIQEITMDYRLEVYLRQTWFDDRLIYNETDEFEYLEYGSTNAPGIWIPDLFFINEKTAEFHDVILPNRLMHIYPSGKIFFSTRLSLTLSCPMLLAKYPFDEQVCPIWIESSMPPRRKRPQRCQLTDGLSTAFQPQKQRRTRHSQNSSDMVDVGASPPAPSASSTSQQLSQPGVDAVHASSLEQSSEIPASSGQECITVTVQIPPHLVTTDTTQLCNKVTVAVQDAVANSDPQEGNLGSHVLNTPPSPDLPLPVGPLDPNAPNPPDCQAMEGPNAPCGQSAQFIFSSVPLTTNVCPKAKAQIWGHEFVNLGLLLPQHANRRRHVLFHFPAQKALQLSSGCRKHPRH